MYQIEVQPLQSLGGEELIVLLFIFFDLGMKSLLYLFCSVEVYYRRNFQIRVFSLELSHTLCESLSSLVRSPSPNLLFISEVGPFFCFVINGSF